METTLSVSIKDTYAIVKEEVWKQLNYEPHDGQVKVHTNTARHKVVDAGRRTGKSTMGGHELVPEAMKTYTMLEDLKSRRKRREFWLVGPEYSDSEKEFRVFWNDLEMLGFPLDKPGSYNNVEGGTMVVSMFDGRFICYAKSAKYPATLVGEGLSGVILVEAAKLKSIVWTKYIRPALADERGWSLHTSTPEGKNHFYDKYMRGQNPDQTEWASWKMPSWTNNIIFPGGRNDPEILDMKNDMTAERFNQEVGADFTEFVGRVFPSFEEEVHVKKLTFDHKYKTFIATDYGFTNPFVCLVIQVDVWDNVYVLGEYRVTNTDIKDISKDLPMWRNGLALQATELYPDPEDPGASSVLSNALKVVTKGNTGGELRWRLELIRQQLKVGPEHAPEHEQAPKLFIDFSCRELIREMQDYRYPETKEEIENKERPENPMKKDDHGPEALGRFMRGYFGGPTQVVAARQSKAKINR